MLYRPFRTGNAKGIYPDVGKLRMLSQSVFHLAPKPVSSSWFQGYRCTAHSYHQLEQPDDKVGLAAKDYLHTRCLLPGRHLACLIVLPVRSEEHTSELQ